nr:heme-copper oxidase subunit III [Angustibacter aerolatus]
MVSRPNMASVGTIVWLSSELMFFAGLFAMYFSIRSVVPEQWVTGPEKLNVPFSAVNTLVLVITPSGAGSVSGRPSSSSRAAPAACCRLKQWGMREWYALTYLFGAVFVAGQVYEYASLVHEGLKISTDGYGSVFYLTTGFHGLHVTGGLIAFLLIIGRSFAARRFGHAEATGAIVTSYYWHFVDVVWIGLFATIYLLQ